MQKSLSDVPGLSGDSHSDVFSTSPCVPGVSPVCQETHIVMSFLHHHVSPVCPWCVPGVSGDSQSDVFSTSPCVPRVSPVCQETLKVSGNKPLSLLLRTHISKNGGTTELIQICCVMVMTTLLKCGRALHPRANQKRCCPKQ